MNVLFTDVEECEGVYPPREDTYLLMKAMEMAGGERFLEVGTGTGILAINAALNGAKAMATDISRKAVECAGRNAARAGVSIDIIRTDIAEGISGEFDVVAFNPPYLPESGEELGDVGGALESPEGGSQAARRYLAALPGILREGGRAYLLVSSLTDTSFMEESEDMEATLVLRRHIFFEDLMVFMFRFRKDL